MLRIMGDLPGPGLEHVSPALAGGFLTTAPPGKSPYLFCVYLSLSTRMLSARDAWSTHLGPDLTQRASTDISPT